ncbi:MAG: TonB-dependent receptor [Gammaproteobacteria bacterium]|nr:TonB-dependent receptor [Gammaproteobacteria bacterium]
MNNNAFTKLPPRHALLPPRHALATAIGLSLAPWVPFGAQAQQPAPAAERLETIVVEGRQYRTEVSSSKFTAPLLDTPKSVSVITSDLIEERAATSLVEALKSVPGVTFNAGEGGQPAGDNLKIRGFDAGADVFVDGIRDAGSQTRDVFALEQVEVVKGPGSAYSGRGSTGGTVNLVTKRPMLDRFSETSVSAGNASHGRATFDGNYTVGDSAAFRLNALIHEADVPGRDEVSLSHRGLAPSFSVGIDRQTRVDLSLYHYRTDDVPDYSIPYSRNAENTAPEGAPVDVDRDNFYGLLNRDFQKTGSDIASVEVSHRLSDRLTLRNHTRYGETSNDYIVTNPDDSRANVANGFVLRNTKSRNSETVTKANLTDVNGHFAAGRTEHAFAAGLEVSNEAMRNRPYDVEITYNANANTDFAGSCSLPGAAGALSDYNCTTLADPNPHDPWTGTIAPSPNMTVAETDTRSLYFFDTMSFGEKWALNLGLRYDDYETRQLSGPVGSPTLLEHRADFWNHQIGAVFKPRPNGSIYASSGTSSNPSGNTLGDGTENLSNGNADLSPERNRSYEIGTKWELANGRLSFDSAVFHTVKRNARVAMEPGRGAPQQTIGEQQVDGFEVGVRGGVTRRLSLIASYTYLDSEIADDGPISLDEGNEFPNTPRNSATLWTTFAMNPRVTVGGGATYVDRRYGNTANTVWAPSYVTYDAMASIAVGDRTSLQLNLQNLTDEVYFVRPYANHYAAIGPGRAAIVTVNFTL